MKLHVNKLIAEKLTEVYTQTQQLPRDLDEDWIHADGYYTFVVCPDGEWNCNQSFFFAGTNGKPIREVGTTVYADWGHPITYKKAMQDVWKFLDKDTRTIIMAEILGRRD